MAHRTTAPQVPSTPIEKPREAIRNPGLHRAMTNPSHQRSDLSRCRSSTYASAIWAPPFTPGERCLARLAPWCLYLSWISNVFFCPRVPPARPVHGPGQHLGCEHAWRPDHHPLRLRRRRLRRVRRALGLPQVRPRLEHRPDPRGGVLGDHAGPAPDAAHGAGHGASDHGADRGAGALPRHPDPDGAPDRDGLLVRVLHAPVAPPGAGAGPEPAQVETAARES